MKAEKYKTFKEDFRFYNDCLVNTCKIGSNKINQDKTCVLVCVESGKFSGLSGDGLKDYIT